MSVDIPKLRRQILSNCRIAEALYSGFYSVCGLVLRMRDLFKWEHGLPPWAEPEPADLLEWIDEKEKNWEAVDHTAFRPLQIDSFEFDPFDVDGVNSLLLPQGLVYGAGYVAGLRPSFFLGELARTETIDGMRVHVVGKELARDLFAIPAMRQGSSIYARRHPMLSFFWDQIFESRPSARNALGMGLAQYGLRLREAAQNPHAHGHRLTSIANEQLDVWIHHEIGEAKETLFPTSFWREIVSTYPDTLIELYARALKDLAADTDDHGLLAHIASRKHTASLAFYVAFLRPLSKILFPEILRAFIVFRKTGSWEAIHHARRTARDRIRHRVRRILSIHEEGKRRGRAWTERTMREKLLAPLSLAEKPRPSSSP